MPNPLYNLLEGEKTENLTAQNFRHFMQMMKGQDPNQKINEFLRSTPISQQQLNQVQQRAQHMKSMLDGMRGMFGF